MAITSVRLRDWDDIHTYDKHGWLYRGQPSLRPALATSLERCLDRFRVPTTRRAALEERLIREFKRAYHQYSAHIPPDSAVLEWLSLMQHYGAPTRLLDFTHSIYVASYFAVEAAESDCLVWAVNGPWAVQETARVLEAAGKPGADEAKEPVTESNEGLAHVWFFTPPFLQLTYPTNPFRLNERLRIQRGTFLIAGDVRRSFADNLRAMRDHDNPQHIIRLVIPKAMRLEALRRLFAMDIARSSLFPGLDGYAQSLGVYHSIYNPTDWKGRAERMPLPKRRSARQAR
jgi:hypothetical protein